MLKQSTLSLTAALALALAPAFAQATAPSTPAAKAPAKPAAKPAAKTAAKPSTATKAVAGTAAAGATVAAAAALSPGQMDAAQRVYTGMAACEFGEQVDIAAVDGKPGHFKLTHKARSYNLVPEETTTGAVRLEDKHAGIVWLQIPSKSMLMNSRIGQRVVDDCKMTQQRG
jgi:hypothetical protein